MIAAEVTSVPSNTFTPSRGAFESRPFRVEPPPFVFDMMPSAFLRAGGDGRDLDRRVLLAVSVPAALIRLRLVGHAADLRSQFLAHDPGGDPRAGQLGRRGQDGRPVDDQHGIEFDLVTRRNGESLDGQTLALGDALLL